MSKVSYTRIFRNNDNEAGTENGDMFLSNLSRKYQTRHLYYDTERNSETKKRKCCDAPTQ